MAVSTCCGCCSLQKGSTIIGFLYFISAAAVVIYLGINLSTLPSTNITENEEVEMNNGLLIQYGIIIERSVQIALIFYTIILLILAGLLIIGAINRNASYVFFFVCMNFGNLAVIFTYSIYQMALVFSITNVLPVMIVYVFTSAAIGMSLNIYMWLVVYNFYQELVTDKFREIFQHNTINYPHPVTPGVVYRS